MDQGHIQFDLSFSKPRRAETRPADDEPFRILVLGDLGGRSATRATTPLAQRKPAGIDIDNFEAVFRRVAPRLDITLDDAAVTLEFSTIDDFHPDSLYERLPPFAALRKLRAELQSPVGYRRAALALGAAPPAEAPPAETEDNAAAVERLLGRKPAAIPPTPTGFDIDRWLRNIVEPHVVPDIADEQRRLVAAVDAAGTELMRRILHDPAFQALEATWRGIERLAMEVETGESLQLFVLDAARDELAQDMAAVAGDLDRSALHRHLCGPDTEPPRGQRWSLLIGDYAFGSDTDDLHLLSALGRLAAQATAPLLAAAQLNLLGCSGLAQLAEPGSWAELDAEARIHWDALRRSPAAPWIGLALPRLLTRLPYGPQTDPIVAFAFDEMPASRDHDAYLWGNPAFALALLAGQAFQQAGWDMDLDRRLDVTGLPSHSYREDGEPKQQPCAELLMSQSAGEAILSRGIMPLMSYRNRDAARLLRWQSIAEPAQALQGAWASVPMG